jgi:hypothetical protein
MSEKPNAPIGKPALALPVIVTTAEKIDGTNEHAAIITRVISDDLVNVMVFPSNGMPYPIPSICRTRQSALGSLSWRFPSRARA